MARFADDSKLNMIIMSVICVVIIMGILMFASESMAPFSKSVGSPYEGFDNALSFFYTRDPTVAPFLSSVTSISGSEEEGKPVEGFAGLQSGPVTEDHGKMGYLAMNEAGPHCKSFGYTKSTGPICFSDEDIRLLTTRGGNFQPLK